MLISVLDDFGIEVFHGEAEEFLFKKENINHDIMV